MVVGDPPFPYLLFYSTPFTGKRIINQHLDILKWNGLVIKVNRSMPEGPILTGWKMDERKKRENAEEREKIHTKEEQKRIVLGKNK